jgi:hypothetical protein
MMQLDDYGTVVYEVGDGMPTSVPINFKCDFAMDQENKAEGKAWVTWTLEEDADGVELYTVPDEDNNVAFQSPTASQTNLATFTLTRTANNPPVGITTITLTVALWYKNSPTLTLKMHEKIYEIVLTASGTESSVVERTSSGADVNPFTVSWGSDTTTGDVTSPLPAGGISFTQIGVTPVPFGSPIQVLATTDDPNYLLWLDNGSPVQVYDATSGGNLLYSWPSTLLTAPRDELTASTSMVIELNSVPAALYNAGDIYVSCPVIFRDEEGGRRGLRLHVSGDKSVRKLADYAPGHANVETSVQLTPIESASGSSTLLVNPLRITSTAAMAGFAMLM